MSRRRKHTASIEYVERIPWPPLSSMKDRERRLIEDAARELARRVARGEKPPGYLAAPLKRFAKYERERWDRIIARNEVAKAAGGEKPFALKRGPGGAFSHVAQKLGRPTAWVERAFYSPAPKKPR